MRTRIATFSAAALLAAGCGGNGGGGGVTLTEFADRSPMTTCSVLTDCFGAELVESFISADCEGTFGALLEEAQVPRYEAAIAAGTMIYHADRAQACLDAVAAAGCSALDNAQLPACDEAFEGTVAAGGACSIDEECVSGTHCEMAAMTCGGTCQAQSGSGGACSADSGCEAGLKCFDGTCRTPAGEGAPCQGADGIDCAGGFVCIGAMAAPPGGTPTPGECMSLEAARTQALGDTCNLQTGPFCQAGLSCALTGVAGTTPVFECVGESVSGGTCNLGFPDPCPSGEYCDAMPFMAGGSFEGTCQELPTGGEACVQGRCAAGHVCDGTSICRAIQHVGGACTAGGECYSGTCDGGVCVEGMLCM